MTEAEKRRMQLLQQTKALYGDGRGAPAIHPRYQSVYGQLYNSKENEAKYNRNSTLGIRVFISALLFALFVVADYKDIEYARVNSARVVHEIERKLDFGFTVVK